ncbi:MAG TPA: LamG-like jellyroll fold domain-containing protein [Polyangiaceae bacterium]|nr:LamG-like jellyroll fold domain-containing protein [Polyangiaceae bacterium]
MSYDTIQDPAGTGLTQRSVLQFVGSSGATDVAVTDDAGNSRTIVSIPTPGILQYHDTTHSPVGLWQLNGSLSDSSGNGNTLTVDTGTARYVDIVPGKLAHFFDGSTRLIVSSFVSALAIAGDMTVEFFLQLDSDPTVGPSVFAHDASGETSGANALYSMDFTSSTNKTPRWFSEHGSGTDDTFTVSAPSGLPPIHNVGHVAIVRSSNTIQFYWNGRTLGSASSALTTPDGGSSGRLRIGGSASNTISRCLICSFKIIASALSANDVKAEYNRTLGPLYGILP